MADKIHPIDMEYRVYTRRLAVDLEDQLCGICLSSRCKKQMPTDEECMFHKEFEKMRKIILEEIEPIWVEIQTELADMTVNRG